MDFLGRNGIIKNRSVNLWFGSVTAIFIAQFSDLLAEKFGPEYRGADGRRLDTQGGKPAGILVLRFRRLVDRRTSIGLCHPLAVGGTVMILSAWCDENAAAGRQTFRPFLYRRRVRNVGCIDYFVNFANISKNSVRLDFVYVRELAGP